MPDLLTLLADVFLACAAMGATIYCIRLSRRLARFSSIDNGLGGAIAVLSRQVDEMTAALAEAKTGSAESERRLDALLGDARHVSDRLEMLVASCHDLSDPPAMPVPDRRAGPAPEPEPDMEAPLFRSIAPQAAQEGIEPLFRHRRSEGR